MKTIIVIDDDVHIGGILEEALRREGYSVLRAYSGTEALMLLSQTTPDLALLDLMLPGMSGEELLPKLQGIPVIVVSAKAGIDQKVDLLLGGAADYVTKPFDIKELMARIAVQLRSGKKSANSPHISAGELEMDTVSFGVTINKNPVHLTRTEFAILKLLMQNPGQVISKSALLDRISLDTPDCMESSLKVHISNLRKKLRDAGDRDYIETVWGIGFKLNI